jgi:hypothetical protein
MPTARAECPKDLSRWFTDSKEERETDRLELVWTSPPRKQFKSQRWTATDRPDKILVNAWAEDVRQQYEPSKRAVRVLRWQARHRYAPSRGQDAAHLFYEEADKWKVETMHSSSTTKMISHPSYLRIIGLAREFRKDEIERLILQELKSEPDHWFDALEAITGQNPVSPDDDFDAAVNAWLDWGHKEGTIANDNAEGIER